MLTTMFRGEMRNIKSLRNPYFELYKYCHIVLINPATYNIINQIESIHPGVSLDEVQENTGFELLVSKTITETQAPNEEQLHLLRNIIDPEGVYI